MDFLVRFGFVDEDILKKIYLSVSNFLTPLTPEETYKTIVDEAVKLVRANNGSLVFEDKGNFYNIYSTSPRQNVKRKRGFIYRVYKQNKARVVQSSEFVKTHPEIANLGIKSIIFIPLFYKNKKLGVLVVNSIQEEFFSKRELEVLQLFGTLASLAIRKTQLHAEASNALSIRDQFIPLAAHELRTPMTTISGYIQLLYSRLSKSNGIEAKWIRELVSENNRLIKTVSELLEINRINAGTLEVNLKECRLYEIVDESVKDIQKNFIGNQINLNNLPNNIKVIGDPKRLKQVIMSLLDNAIKFSPVTANVDVNLRQNNNYAILEVKDRGEGMTEKEQKRIFESFYKGEMGDQKRGLGLGLFLAHKIIEQHQGEVKISSKVGKGTKVQVKLPKLKLSTKGVNSAETRY